MTSPMIEKFSKYRVIFSAGSGSVAATSTLISATSAIPYAIWDERSRLNGMNVCSRTGMVSHIPDAYLTDEQKQFREQSRDADGRLGTLTVIVAMFLPANMIDRLFPDPERPESHQELYARGLQRPVRAGKRSAPRSGPFSIDEIFS